MNLLLGDITKISADDIVNAANTKLQHGGGVAAAIVSAGGSVIKKESDEIGWCNIGKAVVTGAGKLKAKCVIHVPTIDYPNGKRATLDDIKKGVLAAFEIAKNRNCKSVNFPLLGTGVVGLPIVDVARVMKEAALSNPEIKSTLIINSQHNYNLLKDLFN